MHLTHHRSYPCGFAAALSGAAIAFLGILCRPAVAAGTGHLYLQSNGAVVRFPLRAGVPAQQPDLTIPNYGGDIAVGLDGTLYTLKLDKAVGTVVYAFAPGATTPNRRIVMPRNRSCSLHVPPVEALAVDPKGYLYVLAVYSASGARPNVQTPAGTPPLPCAGAYIFSPTASGRVPPVQTIGLDSYYYGGFAVDRRSDLYVALIDDGVTNEYADTIANPHVVRVLTPANPTDVLATDARNNAYLLDIHSGASSVDVWTPRTPGGETPARSILVAYPYNDPAGMVAGNGYLYVDNPLTNTVALYDANGSGTEAPVDVLNVANLGAANAVGP
jgi:hypothetical protein